MNPFDPYHIQKIAEEVSRMWMNYLATFECGDRVIKNTIQYVNIYDAETGKSPPRENIKGIFVEPYGYTGCYILWEGNEKLELCPVSIIQHDN